GARPAGRAGRPAAPGSGGGDPVRGVRAAPSDRSMTFCPKRSGVVPEGVMSEKHVVRFEPVGIEIEVGEDQTILRAAAEQGVMLMHGCKEGQCASCKSFILDGE